MPNIMLTEGSLIEFVILHSETFENIIAVSSRIRPNNIMGPSSKATSFQERCPNKGPT